jgi:hypothetical protein
VACCGGADSMLRFLLEKEDDGMKHCQEMKRRQRAHLGSMGRKCEMVRRCGDVGRRIGGTGDEKGTRRRLLG